MGKIQPLIFGDMKIPADYMELTHEDKIEICDLILDGVYYYIDKKLPTEIDRIDFIKEVLQATIIHNEKFENYELCGVMKDCVNRINE